MIITSLSWAAFVPVNVSAVKDLSCLNNRPASAPNYNCTAKEFTVNTSFSAANDTPPFCMAGQEFEFVVDVQLSGSNTNRYDIGFFVGQSGNDPKNSSTSEYCSVATFPTAPSPWIDLNGNACGDYLSAGETTNSVDKIKVVCSADSATGTLQIPYVVSYMQNSGGSCSGPADVISESGSKCQSGLAQVNGVVAVQVGVWVDITKNTIPSADPQPFTYTASVPSGNKVIALTGATSLTATGTTGGTYTPASIAVATNSTSFTLKDGETARVFMTAPASGTQPLTITESAQNGWDPTASISCSGATTTINNSTRTLTSNLGTASPAATCTITNTKRPTVTLKKVSVGDTGTFSFTGSNGWTTQTITTIATDTAAAGTTQNLTQYVATNITETVPGGYRLNDIDCLIGGNPVANGTISYYTPTANSVSFDANVMSPGAEVDCTFTNIRQRPLTLVKILDPLTDPGVFVLNANGSFSAEGGTGISVSRTVDVTSTVTVAESAGTATDLVNYWPSFSCNTSPAITDSGNSSLAFTMPNADITCTLTNTRRSASLILTKQWETALVSDAVSLFSSGFTNNTSVSASADATGSNSVSSSAVTVYSGESGTIAETFSSGDSNNYITSLACTGTSGLTDAILTVQPIDTAIQCILTNARKHANLTVRKQWINSDPGSLVEVTSSGFINSGSSGISASGGDSISTGTAVLVYAQEAGSFIETFQPTSAGTATDFISQVSCSGTAGFDNNTGILTVGAADTDIICTYSNQAIKPLLTVTKNSTVLYDPQNGSSNPKSIPGARIRYTIRVTNSGPGAVDTDTMVLSDLIPSNVKLFVADIGNGSPVIFNDGSTSSGLSWSYISNSSNTDGLEFSNNNGASWDYVPSADGDGYDNAITHIRFRPSGQMNADIGSDSPWFEVMFEVGVK
jgi:trimeric autotransporter adhesin